MVSQIHHSNIRWTGHVARCLGRQAFVELSRTAAWWTLVTALLLITIGVPTLAAAAVEAALDRDSVPAGRGALMTLRVSGGRVGKIELPEVDNLLIQARGQSQQFEIINGQSSVSAIYNYAVGSTTPGTYQIPPIGVTVDGNKLTSQPLTLKVLAAAATQAPAGIAPLPPSTPPAAADTEDTSGKRFGFLTVEPATSERKHVYVGEIAPVRIRAWLPEDARAQLHSGIQPEGQAFTLHNVSERPQQTSEVRDGKRYTVITWYGGISATKAGSYPASLSLKASVAVRDTSAPQPRRRSGGPFDDPFFDSILDRMNTPMIQQDVTLKSEDQEIEVRPLPTHGRPAGFSGAVGDFKLEAPELPRAWKTGEPQQVSARISGSGNFALVEAPKLSPPDAWKAYPGKGDFTPGDEAAFSGSKSFQFSAVPRKGGTQDVALSFSFFNPDAGAYQTVTSPAQQIQVAGTDLVEQEPNIAAAREPDKPRDPLIGQHAQLTPRRSLVPLVARPEFVRLLVIAALLCVLGGLLGWHRRRRADPMRRARTAEERATREALHAAARCAAAGDVSGYFAAARQALQHRLGSRWRQPAHAITLAEVTARMPADSPVASFFREADRNAYGHSAADGDFPQWQALLADAMASLTE